MNPGNILICLIFQTPWGQNNVLHLYEGSEHVQQQWMNSQLVSRRKWNMEIQIDKKNNETFVYRLLIILGAIWKLQKHYSFKSQTINELKVCSIHGFMKRNFGRVMGFMVEILRQASMFIDEQENSLLAILFAFLTTYQFRILISSLKFKYWKRSITVLLPKSWPSP